MRSWESRQMKREGDNTGIRMLGDGEGDWRVRIANDAIESESTLRNLSIAELGVKRSENKNPIKVARKITTVPILISRAHCCKHISPASHHISPCSSHTSDVAETPVMWQSSPLYCTIFRIHTQRSVRPVSRLAFLVEHPGIHDGTGSTRQRQGNGRGRLRA